MVDKKKRTSRRIKGALQVQNVLDVLGSSQNVTLTQLARNRRIVFVEGQDFQTLRAIARKLGRTDLANGTGITILPIGGFTAWSRLEAIAWAFEKALGHKLKIAAIFDRDYRSAEENDGIRKELEKKGDIDFVHFHSRKELENYVLDIDVLNRVSASSVEERARRNGREAEQYPDIGKLINEVTDPTRGAVQAQYIAHHIRYNRSIGIDVATITEKATEWFGKEWEDLTRRLAVVPGKDCLSALNKVLQTRFSITLSASRIIAGMHVNEIAEDMRVLITRLDHFRTAESVQDDRV